MALVGNTDNQWDWDEEDNYTSQHRSRADSWDEDDGLGASNSDAYASVRQVSAAASSSSRPLNHRAAPSTQNSGDLFAVRVNSYLRLISLTSCW